MVYTSQFFDPKEFIRDGLDWLPRMSEELLIKLDLLRLNWGKPISISPHKLALGRIGKGASYHYWKSHGAVLAVDILPADINFDGDARRFYEAAMYCGFTGIGFYPHWQPRPGFHLDIRCDRNMLSPAKWGQVVTNGQKEWCTIDQAFDLMI